MIILTKLCKHCGKMGNYNQDSWESGYLNGFPMDGRCGPCYDAWIDKKFPHINISRLNRNQPERSKRENSQKCEMRCSEHCRNAVRDK